MASSNGGLGQGSQQGGNTAAFEVKVNNPQLLADVRAKSVITIDDDLQFKRIVDALNGLFDKGYKGYQHSGAKVNDGDEYSRVWFPKLARREHGVWYEGVQHWYNIPVDSDTLIEYPASGFKLKTPFDPESEWTEGGHVFVCGGVYNKNEPMFYKFIGVFKPAAPEPAKKFGTLPNIEPDNPVAVFKRCAVQAHLPALAGGIRR